MDQWLEVNVSSSGRIARGDVFELSEGGSPGATPVASATAADVPALLRALADKLEVAR